MTIHVTLASPTDGSFHTTLNADNQYRDSDRMIITPLGAGNEVGRSCHLLQFKGKTILLDCGIHPAYTGLAALPFFDEVDPATVDVILITHFHLDHAASLPYFTEKTNFKGRIFMTHPTRAIFKWLLSDYVKVSTTSPEDQLYDEEDLLACHAKIEAVDYRQEVEVEGIMKFTALNAGHVLGAAMFLMDIAGVKILYTGDYSREEDRHLMAAELPAPGIQVDVLITESTYGVQSHEPRLQREQRFTGMVHDVVARGGRLLLPVFALGRAQELLLILDEYWRAHPELHSIPIYYASALARKCMTVYQTYIHQMNERIRKAFAKGRNPFVFKHISHLKSINQFEDTGPCVMMASPGMLQSGLSRELFEMWCPDRRNGVIIPGYCVDGTLAKHVLSEPKEIISMNGAKLPRRLSVAYISFSAHVDFTQNSAFIDAIHPQHLILVHGDANEMGRLRAALQYRYDERRTTSANTTAVTSTSTTANTVAQPKVHAPKNGEQVLLYFRGDTTAKAMGRLAQQAPRSRQRLAGVLVTRDYEHHLMSAEELPRFSDTCQAELMQSMQWTLHGVNWSLVVRRLERLFGKSVIDRDTVHNSLMVMKNVHVEMKQEVVIVRWRGDTLSDVIADACLAALVHLDSSRSSVKISNHSCSSSHDTDTALLKHDQENHRADLCAYLAEYYENVPRQADANGMIVWQIDKVSVQLHCNTWRLKCSDVAVRRAVTQVIARWRDMTEGLAPLELRGELEKEEIDSNSTIKQEEMVQ